MSKALPFMQFYPADWLADCQILSLAARGAWQTIICKAWNPETPGCVELKLSAWARLFGCPSDLAEKVIAELEETKVANVEHIGDSVRVTCRRISRDLEAQTARSKELSEAGKRGMQKRWGKPPNNQENNHPNKVAIARLYPGYNISEAEAEAEEYPPTPQPETEPCGSLGGGVAAQPAPKPRPVKAKTPLMRRVENWFRRRESTPWTAKELDAWRKNKCEEIVEDDLLALEWYYTKSGAKFIRHDLCTLVNNWPGEIDRAHGELLNRRLTSPPPENTTTTPKPQKPPWQNHAETVFSEIRDFAANDMPAITQGCLLRARNAWSYVVTAEKQNEAKDWLIRALKAEGSKNPENYLAQLEEAPKFSHFVTEASNES